jgi:hypothetical protein
MVARCREWQCGHVSSLINTMAAVMSGAQELNRPAGVNERRDHDLGPVTSTRSSRSLASRVPSGLR